MSDDNGFGGSRYNHNYRDDYSFIDHENKQSLYKRIAELTEENLSLKQRIRELENEPRT